MPTDDDTRLAQTLELPSRSAKRDGDPGARNGSGSSLRNTGKRSWHVGLVEGSQPSLSQEAQQLLKVRLRMAALLLFGGYLTFLVAFGIYEFHSTSWIFYGHVAITAVTGLVGLRLCTDCQFMLRHLRMAELLVFGGSAVYFSLTSYHRVIQSAGQGFAEPGVGPWLLLIFTYALFIPNTWQRAAAVIVPMAIIPVVVQLVAKATSRDFVEVLADPQFHNVAAVTEMVLIFGATIAIAGVYNIRSLRREAYEARQLGQYRLKRELGAGGMGKVYLAEHLMLKRPCAIKLIQPDKAGDPAALARFEREVRATAKLTHWNTVEIFDYGRTDDDTFYYVMEYLPGMNLQELIQMHGAMPPQRVVYLMLQTCDALCEAHAQGLIHRDIKPANIFAARRGGRYDVAKLLDFGLVRSSVATPDTALTREGAITGSPLFMSPEQGLGEQPDHRSDLYSLGAVAFFMLTGRPPFEDDNPMRVLMAHVRDVPQPPSKLVPGLPEDLERIVMRCLEKKRSDRFQDVRSLREAFAGCETNGQWTEQQATDWWHHHGCPKKRELDAEVLELACV